MAPPHLTGPRCIDQWQPVHRMGPMGAIARGGRSRILVLCYHAVSEEWDAALSVTPDAFRRQLTRLLACGWRATTFTDAVLDPPAAKTLAVTFDDAFDSVRTKASPILAELGIPA